MLDIKEVVRILKTTAYGDDAVKIVADFLSCLIFYVFRHDV